MSKAAELANLIGNINAGGGGVNRNVVINGAMNVAQRGTSSTGIGASSGYFTVDRWKIVASATAGRLTMTQDSSVPTGKGFANSIKLDCTTADTSIATGEFLLFRQSIEGQNLQGFAKGTSEAKPFVLSFYVKGNANATYVAELADVDNSRTAGKAFNVTTDWTRVELTFTTDTTGAFDDDNSASLELSIWLHAGATFNDPSGTLQQTFASTTNSNRAVGISSFFSSTDNTFFITGVQLEVGQNPTEFEHRPIDLEFHRCLRYFEKLQNTDSSTTQKLGTGSSNLGGGIWYGAGQVIGGFDYKLTKRATPTIACDDDQGLKCYTGQASRTVNDSNMFDIIRVSDCRLNLGNFNINGTQGYGTWVLIDTDHFITIDAEL